jgi:CHAT domain-containing protein
MFVKSPTSRLARFVKSPLFLHLCILTFLSTSTGQAQENPRRDIGAPTELEPTDPEIRQLLAQISSTCSPFSIENRVEIIQRALKLADSRGLVGDRAVVEAALASAYIGQVQADLSFNTFRKALQDAVDSKNLVLQADILISLASEAQLKGNIQQSTELISKAQSLSEKSGSLLVKARALGEIGRMKLLAGKLDEAERSIDEALQIDKLNGYRFESLHLLYRGYYLGLTGKTDQAIDSLSQARARAVAIKDAYSFVMSENAYAFGLVQKGKPDEAIADMELVRQGHLQKFITDDGARTCITSAIELPVFHIAVLEGLTNVLRAAKEKEKELVVWHELHMYSHDHSFLGGEAEAAQKIGDLDNQLKKTDEALEYYALAADLFRKLQNDSLLAQVQISESLLLIQVGRPKEAFPLEEEVASYARSHNLRSAEFTAYGVLAEIYQPAGDLDHARDALEKALSLVHPGPFDEEIDNRAVLEDYLRLADVYKALNNPTRELVAIDSGYFVSVHLKDEKVPGNLVNYLDQRLKELGIRESVGQKQKEDRLADSLIYSYVLQIRDGFPPNPADDSNWQRILTLPFQIASKPGGAATLVEILGQIGPLVGFEKLPILDALARYYINAGADAKLAEKYALAAESVVKEMKGDMAALKSESSCVLAVAYSRQTKKALAQERSTECLILAGKTHDEQTIINAEAMNAMAQAELGNLAAAKASLENIIQKSPENPELHVELALSLINARLYDEAQSQLDFAVKRFVSTGDKNAEASAYIRGAIVLGSDDSPSARKLQLHYLNEGQQIYHDLHATDDEAKTFIAMGEYYLKVLQMDNAILDFNKAYELAQSVRRMDITAQATSELGNAYQGQKDFRKAADFHRKAVAAYAGLNFTLPQVIALESLSEDYVALHQTDDALGALLEAKGIAALIPVPNQYFLHYFLGEFYRKQGQFEKALAELRDAVEATNKGGDLEHCAYGHLAIAELDGLIGGWEDAVSETQIALNLFQDLGDKKGQAACWADMTGIYTDRTSSVKNFQKAQECYAKARELGFGESLELDLAELYLQNGNYAELITIANASLESCIKGANTDCQAHALISVSEAKRLSGKVKAARTALNEANPLVKNSQDIYLQGRFLYAEARQLTSEHKLDEALAAYKRLIRLIETVKGDLDTRDQRSLSENYGYIYDELVVLLYSMSKSDSKEQQKFASESLEYAEENKAKQFVEAWGRTFVDQMRRSLPAHIQEAERSLFSKRERLLANLAISGERSGSVGDEKKIVQAELETAQQEIASFLQELRRTAPQYSAVAYPEPIHVGSLPLRDGETLVEFKLTSDSAFAWIIQNRSDNGNQLVAFYKIPFARTWFLDRVSRIRNALNSGHPEAVDWKSTEELFRALFPGEVAKILEESQELIFIPDDVLFAVPFELFSPNASKGDFVLLKKASTYYPSAVAFRLSRTAAHNSNWQEAFLGLADPITSSDDERFEAASATISTKGEHTAGETDGTHENASADSGKLQSRGFSFERLPGTAVEVRNIAALLQKANEKIEIRFGIDATKRQLLDTDLTKFRFLHFATHGTLPVDTNIQEPALVFSYDGAGQSHMFLQMSEVLDLKLRSESVVLSACNTGSGRISKAEGVMSLGRAFLAAGSSSVTVSLWQVSDESTATLMEEYYRHLLKHERKSAALAEARFAVFSKGFKDPFFWAPFILIGE